MDGSQTARPQRTAKNSGQRVRRPRAARACDLCRLKKNKCDELYPCTYCKSRDAKCVYKGQDMARRRFTSEYVRQLEDQVKNLSALVEKTQISEQGDTSLSAGTPSAAIQNDTVQNRDSHQYRSGELDTTSTPNSTSTRLAGEQEVSGVNRHTQNVEFYGSSSSVALLSHVQRTGEELEGDPTALLSSLHNPAFRLGESHTTHEEGHEARQPAQAINYPHCRGFLENYFSTIHYVHPILDKPSFLERFEAFWSGNESMSSTSSFMALYYSVLSLGALVGVRDDEPVGGRDNIQWSRKFFDESKICCNQLGMVTDLEMVQCYFILAKVCQNELNSHWCYMYVGLAVRTALAMGINREPGPNTKKSPSMLRAESRTWWGLYSLETEMSFAMGRPDTLGADLYHNRQFPLVKGADNPGSRGPELLDPPYCAVIKCMVDFSRIARNICLSIYLPDTSASITVSLAYEIENDLEIWVNSLPEAIRPKPREAQPSLKDSKDAQWAKRQRLVLTIRYHNLRILLFGSFLLRSSASERASIPRSREGVEKCLDSAKQTINIIYETYRHNDYFRTWFYNTTYTVFAASIILVYTTQVAVGAEVQPLLHLVDMAIEILEIMDECVVALQAAKLLRRAKEKAAARFTAAAAAVTTDPGPDPGPDPTLLEADGTVHLNHYWGPLNLLDGDMDLDFTFQLTDFDAGNSSITGLDDFDGA